MSAADDGRRVTASGIALPDPEGYPAAILNTDVPQLMVNIAVPEGIDRNVFVQDLARRISLKQRDLEAADMDAWEPLQLADAHAGDEFYLTPCGARHILGVGHGRMATVDPLAASKHRKLIDARGLPPLPPFQPHVR